MLNMICCAWDRVKKDMVIMMINIDVKIRPGQDTLELLTFLEGNKNWVKVLILIPPLWEPDKLFLNQRTNIFCISLLGSNGFALSRILQIFSIKFQKLPLSNIYQIGRYWCWIRNEALRKLSERWSQIFPLLL